MNYSKLFFYFTACLIFFNSCASVQTLNRPKINKNPFQEAESFYYYSLGYLNELENEIDRALEYYNLSTKYSYTPGSIYKEMAYIYGLKGDNAEAINMIEKGLKEDPYNPEILLIAARMRMENEKHEDAKKLLERIIETDPLYADAYFYL
ncbi:MAG TPA: tetratricopeptide repeat protein [Candidatus Goldiibacteriota bacterium]|nr:tetratricopeptide repeat protein [Candidatus Goldiibacteriota bacterium]